MSLPLHHADLIGSAFSLSGQWFVYKRKWWGWLLCSAGAVCFCWVNAHFGAWGMEPISTFAALMSLRSAVKWLQSRRISCYTEGTK